MIYTYYSKYFINSLIESSRRHFQTNNYALQIIAVSISTTNIRYHNFLQHKLTSEWGQDCVVQNTVFASIRWALWLCTCYLIAGRLFCARPITTRLPRSAVANATVSVTDYTLCIPWPCAQYKFQIYLKVQIKLNLFYSILYF